MVGLWYYKTRLHKALSLLLAMALFVAGLTGFAQTARADSPHIVTVKADSGCSVFDSKGNALLGENSMQHGASLQFKVVLEDATQKDATVKVTVNGKAVKAAEGLYTIQNIQDDLEIRVTLAKPAQETPNGRGKKAAQTRKTAQVSKEEQPAAQEEEKPAAQEEKKPVTQEEKLPATQEEKKPVAQAQPEETKQEQAAGAASPGKEADAQPAKPEETPEKNDAEGTQDKQTDAQDQIGTQENPAPAEKGNTDKIRTYKMTLPVDNEKFSISFPEGYDPNAIPLGSSFVFSVKPSAAYADVVPEVRANGTLLRGAKKGGAWQYSIKCISCNITITVNDASWPVPPQPASYTVTLPGGAGYAVQNIKGGKELSTGKYSVEQGGTLSFEVAVEKGYDASKLTVTANGKALSLHNGVYSVANVQADTEVMISVPKEEQAAKTYTVSLPNGAGYAVKDMQGGKELGGGKYSVEQDGTLSFKVEVQKGYDESRLMVTANGKELSAKKGVYTLANIQEDIGVAISVPKVDAYRHTVSFSSGKGYSVQNVTGGKELGNNTYTVRHKGSMSFTVKVEKSYRDRELFVTANGRELLPDAYGIYRLPSITEDVEVNIGFTRERQYTVTFPDSSVAKVTNIKGGIWKDDLRYGVMAGDNLSFEVYVKSSYENARLTVRANGKEIKQQNGVYTLKDIQEDIKVTISLDEALIRFSLTDKATSVNVSGYSKKTPKLHVDTLSDSSSAYNKLEAQTDGLRVLGAYDVSLSGSPAVGDVTVTFPVDKAYNGRSVRILRLRSDGKIAKYTATVKNGKATITVSALGKFLIAGAQDPSVILPPKTGDGDRSAAMLGWGMVLLAELMILGIIRHKRKQEQEA